MPILAGVVVLFFLPVKIILAFTVFLFNTGLHFANTFFEAAGCPVYRYYQVEDKLVKEIGEYGVENIFHGVKIGCLRINRPVKSCNSPLFLTLFTEKPKNKLLVFHINNVG